MKRRSGIKASPSVWMSLILVISYLTLALAGGNALSLNYNLAYPLAQVNEAVWRGAVWMLFTSIFLHADPSHLGGNVLFLLIFGTSLEEQVSTRRWVAAFLSSGLAGNMLFLLVGGDSIGVGASGAVWGLLGAAGGLRGLFGMMFYVGLSIFSGGGFLAHAGGLVAGLTLRYRWFGRISG